MLRDSRRRFCITLVALGVAACRNDVNVVAPRTGTPSKPRVSRSALSCTATLHPQTVTCKPVGTSSGASQSASTIRRNVIVGKQNVYVYLGLSGFAFNSATNVFSFNTTVQNLMTQPIGTQNGTTVAGGGVQVFFTNGPFVACGSGTVSPIGTSLGTFTASGQQYYQYNQIIQPDSTSATKLWQFQLSPAVCGFNFFVEVSGDMPAEGSVLLWKPIHQGVSSDKLVSVWQDSSDDVFAVGLSGTLIHYDGTTWSQVPPSPVAGYAPHSVYGSSKSDVWVVGDASLTAHYNGSSFTQVSTPVTVNLKGVWETSATNVYAVGFGGAVSVVLQSTNGTSWTNLALPHGVADSLRAIWGADATHIFIVGDAGRILGYNGSGTWTQFARPTGNPPFRGVWGTSATNVYAVATNGTIWHYNGTAWSSMTSPVTTELDGIGGTSNSNIWAVGVNGTTLHYNGTAWSTVAPIVGLNLNGVTGTNVSPQWAVGDAGTLISLSSTAGTMSTQSGLPIYKIWAASATDVWASSIGTMLHYNGTNWTPYYVSAADTMYAMWGISSTDVHSIGVNATVSIWNGTSWTVSNTFTGGTGWRAEWGASDNSLCAAGAAGQVYCNSSGTTARAGLVLLTGLWGSSANAIYTTSVSGGIWETTNGGTSFVSQTTNTADSLFAIFGTGANAIWACGQAGTMLFSNNGTSWAAQSSGTTNDLRGIWADGPPTGYTADVYAVGDAGTVRHYNGTTWTTMWTGTTTTLRTVFGTSPTNVFIGGDNGLILIGSQ